jgi:hypothetical protein
VGAYAYDGLTRRVSKESGSEVTRRDFYYSDQWQVLEERLFDSRFAERTFVWGLRYIDDLVLRDVEAGPGAGRLYATHDQWHIIAITNDAGDVVERLAYGAFGTSIVLNAEFSVREPSFFGWET